MTGDPHVAASEPAPQAHPSQVPAGARTQEQAFEIQVIVRGIEVMTEAPYGPRSERPELARLSIPIDPVKAWEIFKNATHVVTAPLAAPSSDEEQRRAIDAFTRPIAR